MITKQKIKALERALKAQRGEKIYTCIKKFSKEEYFYINKTYSNIEDLEKFLNLNEDDILVNIISYVY